MVKHNLYKVSGLILSAALIIPLFASAQTDTSLSGQIQSLMSQITSLEQQLHALVQSTVGSSTLSGWQAASPNAPTTLPTTGGGGSVACPMIARDLSIGAQGADVSQLQSYLISNGFLSASSTGFFGPLTAQALAQFQAKMGIASSTGFFGPLTRNFLNGHCGGYGNGGYGRTSSSTPPMMNWSGHSTSTPSAGGGWSNWSANPPASTTSDMPCMQAYSPPSDAAGSGAAGTNIMIMRPCGSGGTPPPVGPFRNGSTTSATPCPQSSIENGASVAAVAAALFIPHAILPGMNGNPCPNGSAAGAPSTGGQGGNGN